MEVIPWGPRESGGGLGQVCWLELVTQTSSFHSSTNSCFLNTCCMPGVQQPVGYMGRHWGWGCRDFDWGSTVLACGLKEDTLWAETREPGQSWRRVPDVVPGQVPEAALQVGPGWWGPPSWAMNWVFSQR